MTRDELIRHLLSTVESKQRRNNKRFTASAMSEVREFITSGVDRMTDAERNSSSSVILAQSNLEHVILACYNRSQQRREYEISRETFVTIRMMECPKWPYC